MKSMTGFGKSHKTQSNIECDIEIKSVNGRYLDFKSYLPRELSFFEHSLRTALSRYVSRGTIEIRVNISDLREPKVRLNESKLRKYHEIILQAQKVLGIEGDPPLQYILEEPGVIQSLNQLDEDPDMLSILKETLNEALTNLQDSMYKEAEDIKAVLTDSMNQILPALRRIGEKIQPFKEELFTNMLKRISDIVSTYKLENLEQRIVQETAIYVDKYDIQEEISRLESHISTFLDTLDKPKQEDIGKTLNFISQEMQREANTLGSKFSNSKTFPYILIIKEEIEKCREIVQNVA
ncbi:MAG: YicC family protein [Candidatus Cloacimonetes bacterium]|nr:YicC family protein [Candidatus Cloacimonadota bacterium]MCK9184188.1 YicC family protein [Candidatus Cloacimonadota bacterium]